MFNVFNSNGSKGIEGVYDANSLSGQVYELLTRSEFVTNTIGCIIGMFGEEKMKALELEIANSMYNTINDQENYGESFMIALFALLHATSILDSLEKDFDEWSD